TCEFTNHLLSTLTSDEISLLLPLRPMELRAGECLLRAGDKVAQVIFPENGVVSLLARISEGRAIEVAMVGREGFIGSSVVAGIGYAPTDVSVQASGTAYTVPRMRFLQ